MKLDKDFAPGDSAHTKALPRHLLGYPIMHHKINDETWGEKRNKFDNPKRIDGRFSSPLAFAGKKQGNQLIGRIVHLPYAVSMKFDGNQIEIWKTVHGFLDKQPSLSRMGGQQ